MEDECRYAYHSSYARKDWDDVGIPGAVEWAEVEVVEYSLRCWIRRNTWRQACCRRFCEVHLGFDGRKLLLLVSTQRGEQEKKDIRACI